MYVSVYIHIHSSKLVVELDSHGIPPPSFEVIKADCAARSSGNHGWNCWEQPEDQPLRRWSAPHRVFVQADGMAKPSANMSRTTLKDGRYFVCNHMAMGVCLKIRATQKWWPSPVARDTPEVAMEHADHQDRLNGKSTEAREAVFIWRWNMMKPYKVRSLWTYMRFPVSCFTRIAHRWYVGMLFPFEPFLLVYIYIYIYIICTYT